MDIGDLSHVLHFFVDVVWALQQKMGCGTTQKRETNRRNSHKLCPTSHYLTLASNLLMVLDLDHKFQALL